MKSKGCFIVALFIYCQLSAFSLMGDELQTPTINDILAGIQKSEALFFQSDGFLVRTERTKCEEVTPNRYSGGYINTEFIVAGKKEMWFTSKTHTQIGKKNKEGRNMVTFANGADVYVPLEPDINLVKNHHVLSWNQKGISASFGRFTCGGNMHQCNDFFRHVGWDFSRRLIESEGGNFAAIKKKEEWLGDYIDHPMLPEYLEKNISKYSVSDAREKIDGFPCWIVEYPGMDKFWIDVEHGYVIRKRIYHWGPGKPKAYAIHNMDFREVKPGLWLPWQQVVEKYTSIVSEDKKIWDKVAARLYYTTKEIIIDNVPEKIFEPEIAAGTQIFDSAKNTTYTVSDKNFDPFTGSIRQGGTVSRFTVFLAVFIVSGSLLIAVWMIFQKKK